MRLELIFRLLFQILGDCCNALLRFPVAVMFSNAQTFNFPPAINSFKRTLQKVAKDFQTVLIRLLAQRAPEPTTMLTHCSLQMSFRPLLEFNTQIYQNSKL
jgi:hypothetical protein